MIRTEKCSTEKLIRDADYHVAKLRTTAATAEMIPATQQVIQDLRQEQAEHEAKEQDLVATRETYDSTGRELTLTLRRIRQATYTVVDLNRNHPTYVTLWPQGTRWIWRIRGREARQRARAVAAVLESTFPEIHALFGEPLAQVIAAAEQAEDAYRAAQTAQRISFSEILKRRVALTNKMRTNWAQLRGIYPRNLRRVSAFFRSARSSESEEGDASNPTHEPTEDLESTEATEYDSPATDPEEVPTNETEPEPAKQAV